MFLNENNKKYPEVMIYNSIEEWLNFLKNNNF